MCSWPSDWLAISAATPTGFCLTVCLTACLTACLTECLTEFLTECLTSCLTECLTACFGALKPCALEWCCREGSAPSCCREVL